MPNVIYILLRRLHTPLLLLIGVYAVSVLGFTLIPGVASGGEPYYMDFFHAFYVVSYTATTIGFGELPHPFSPAQRLWATGSIYATVVAWIYAIGSLIATFQDPAFRALIAQNRVRRAVQHMGESFYLVCGYGDTGSALVRALTDYGLRAVVVDIDPNRVSALELEDLRSYAPGLCADAVEPQTLIEAGLQHPRCAGVIAVTNFDMVNLQIAITAKLLRPRLRVVCRAESRDVGANMASFGTDHIINPFDIFAERLALALHAPGMFLVHEWVTSVPHEPLREPLFPPHGRWIVCGYGRFGKALHERLAVEDISITVIEANPAGTQPPPGSVIGRGTEAHTLREAHVETAVGIVAGTDVDANNLSIIMTARELNPKLFMVARQNRLTNQAIFAAADLHLTMQRSSIIAHKIFALIRSPLLADFLTLAGTQTNEWANELAARISAVTQEKAPHIWAVRLNAQDAPALWQALMDGETVTLGDLFRDPHDREQTLGCIALLVKHEEKEPLLPTDDYELTAGDELLFCGRYRASQWMDWTLKNENVLKYLLHGEAPRGTASVREPAPSERM
ncbi:MAG: NAD-binding protein [Pseudomonadota bacterium]|nr:MAG: NAD-binding protein [Pseudomonadota bacterium]